MQVGGNQHLAAGSRAEVHDIAQAARRLAIVRLGGKQTLTSEVLNKSSGGYGIAVSPDHIDAFPPGRILVLEVDELVVQVKVAHVAEDPEEDRYLVGLERIVELEDKAPS